MNKFPCNLNCEIIFPSTFFFLSPLSFAAEMKRPDSSGPYNSVENIANDIKCKRFKAGRPRTKGISIVPIDPEKVAEIEKTYVAPHILFITQGRKLTFPAYLDVYHGITMTSDPEKCSEIMRVNRRVQVRRAQTLNREKKREQKQSGSKGHFVHSQEVFLEPFHAFPLDVTPLTEADFID